jgi:hypothetical protein
LLTATLGCSRLAGAIAGANALLAERVNPEVRLPTIPPILLPIPVDFIEADAPGVPDAGSNVPSGKDQQ